MKLKTNFFINLILFTGILLIGWSFVSEIYFHYIADFTPNNIDPDVFWRAEYSEIINSLFLLILGIILTTFALILKFKKTKGKYKRK